MRSKALFRKVDFFVFFVFFLFLSGSQDSISDGGEELYLYRLSDSEHEFVSI